MKISAVVLTKNEEENIVDCLKSLSFCDEIIVIDDYSEDKTLEKCQMSNVKCQIFKRRLNDNFAAQRNFGLSKAKNEWVLFVDADERVPEALASEISNIKFQMSKEISGFYLRRLDFMWGKKLKHGEAGSIKLLRLARRGAGRWKRRVHEYWDIKGPKKTLKNSLLHYPHPTMADFLGSVNKFSGLHARENFEEGKRSTLFRIIIMPSGHLFHNFIIRRGLLDGMRGFVFALIMSFHSFLAWSKLWLYQKNPKN